MKGIVLYRQKGCPIPDTRKDVNGIICCIARWDRMVGIVCCWQVRLVLYIESASVRVIMYRDL